MNLSESKVSVVSRHGWVAACVVGWSLMLSPPALALDRDTCPTDRDRAVLVRFGDRVESRETVGEAQDLAMSKLRVGRRALKRARAILPGRSAALDEADLRLGTLEDAVLAGTSPAEVAAPFRDLAQLGGGCQYTTTEIVVIVIGFVLGILPGVIFLFLFC